MDGRKVMELGIKGGARNLGRDDIGEIAPGFAADFVAWRTDAIGFAGGMMDPIGALIFCTPTIGTVDLSVINGDIIVKDGKLQTIDLKVGFVCMLSSCCCTSSDAAAFYNKPVDTLKFSCSCGADVIVACN